MDPKDRENHINTVDNGHVEIQMNNRLTSGGNRVQNPHSFQQFLDEIDWRQNETDRSRVDIFVTFWMHAAEMNAAGAI